MVPESLRSFLWIELRISKWILTLEFWGFLSVPSLLESCPSFLFSWELVLHLPPHLTDQENKSPCRSKHLLDVSQTRGVSGCTSAYPHLQEPLKRRRVGDHRAAARCDHITHTGSDRQIASVAVVRLPEWLPLPADPVFFSEARRGVTLLGSLCAGKHGRLTSTSRNYSISLFPLHRSAGIKDALGFLCSHEGLEHHKPLWLFSLIIRFLLIWMKCCFCVRRRRTSWQADFAVAAVETFEMLYLLREFIRSAHSDTGVTFCFSPAGPPLCIYFYFLPAVETWEADSNRERGGQSEQMWWRNRGNEKMRASAFGSWTFFAALLKTVGEQWSSNVSADIWGQRGCHLLTDLCQPTDCNRGSVAVLSEY